MKPVNFKEALKDSCGFAISPGCKTENEGFMTMLRVDRDTIPEGWYAYDVRGLNAPQTIEPFVGVNHYGTFLTKKEIIFPRRKTNPNDKYLCLCGRGGYTYTDN